MIRIFSVIWLNVRDAFTRKNENPDEPYGLESFNTQMEIAKKHEPETYEEFKDK